MGIKTPEKMKQGSMVGVFLVVVGIFILYVLWVVFWFPSQQAQCRGSVIDYYKGEPIYGSDLEGYCDKYNPFPWPFGPGGDFVPD